MIMNEEIKTTTDVSRDYKREIEDTRVGCLGGSDARMLAQIASLGYVPQSAQTQKRIAVLKGLMPHEEAPKSVAMLYGDKMEQDIYAYMLKGVSAEVQSNPLWVSNRYSKKDVKLICHPDFVYYDKEKNVLNVYECKTTKFCIDETKRTYRAQLYIEYLLAKEQAQAIGPKCLAKLHLVHYSTEGLNIESVEDIDAIPFDPSRLSVGVVRFTTQVFDVERAMKITQKYLKDFDIYKVDDEIDYTYLPQRVKNEFDMIAVTLAEIKQREEKVAAFKRQLYDFLKEKNIKSIKSEAFTITRILPTESVSFDYKRYLEDFAKQHPQKIRKLMKDYEKRTQRKGSVQIRLKEDKK